MFAPQSDRDEVAARDAAPARRSASRPRRRARRGLDDRARVLEDVLHRGADLVGVDEDHVVDVAAREPEGLDADLLDGDAVGEEADVGERDARPARSERSIAFASSGSTPTTLISGRRRFTYAAMPPIRPPPPTATKIVSIGSRSCAQDLHRDRALPGDHVGVVVGVDEDELPAAARCASPRRRHRRTSRLRARRSAPSAATESTLICGVVTGITIVARVPSRCAAARRPGRDCRPTRRRPLAATRAGGEAGHLVVGAAQLEREDRLQVLALEEAAVAEPLRERGASCSGVSIATS